MNYKEEYRRLHEDQEKLDTIRRRNARKWKKLALYGLGFMPPVLTTVWFVNIKFDESVPTPAIYFLAVLLALIVSAVTTAPIILNGNDIIEWYEDWKSDTSEEARLRKSEADRKAKMAFFERLINDTDFRAAWEAQMKEKA